MPSGADLEYARLLSASSQSSGAGLDGARLSQLEDEFHSGVVSITAPPPSGSDDTLVLQGVLNKAASLQVGNLPEVLNGSNSFPIRANVIIGSGTYIISDSLNKPNGVSIQMSTSTILKATGSMSNKPLLTAPIGSVPDQHSTIRGGILDCNDSAQDGISFPWFAHITIDDVQIFSPLRHFVVLGDPAAPSSSYEGIIRGLDTRRKRGSNPPVGSVGIWLRNASDCEVISCTINGSDIGTLTDLGGTTFTQVHVWNFGSSALPSVAFKDNTTFYTTSYVECKADSPSQYGFHLAGGWGHIIGGTVYANNNVPDNVLIGVQIGGSQGLVDINNLAIIGSSVTNRIAQDVVGPTLFSNIDVRNTNVVIENIGTQTRRRRLRLSEPGGGTELSIQKQAGNTANFAQFLRASDAAIVGQVGRYGEYIGPATNPPVLSGQYFYPVSPGGTSTAASLTNGTLRLAPWRIERSISIDRIAADISAVGDAGSKLRLGIYADDGSGRPGALVLDAGTVNGDSATVQELTVSLTLTPGIYWIGAVVQSVVTTQPTVRIATVWHPPVAIPVGSALPPAGNAPIAHTMNGVTGALPSVFTSNGVSGNVPRLILRAV